MDNELSFDDIEGVDRSRIKALVAATKVSGHIPFLYTVKYVRRRRAKGYISPEDREHVEYS